MRFVHAVSIERLTSTSTHQKATRSVYTSLSSRITLCGDVEYVVYIQMYGNTNNSATLLRAAPHTPHSLCLPAIRYSQNVNMLTFNVLRCFSTYTHRDRHSLRSHFFPSHFSIQFKFTYINKWAIFLLKTFCA